MLWPEDMPPDTVICMSGEDRLVPNSLILRHLRAVNSSIQARSLTVSAQDGICTAASFSLDENTVHPC